MSLIYLSSDELNRALVRTWAGRRGIPVACPGRADDPLPGRPCALLLDLDHLPPGWLEGILPRLGASRSPCVVAAHGYGPHAGALCARGLTVYSRLHARVVADLVSSAKSAARTPAPKESDSLTWIDLA
jgi:hypothetical protein